jgi:hypothetical protein
MRKLPLAIFGIVAAGVLFAAAMLHKEPRLQKYERVQAGMTPDEVIAILGEPQLRPATNLFVWQDDDCSVTVLFEQGGAVCPVGVLLFRDPSSPGWLSRWLGR